MWSPLVRRHFSEPPSMVFISVILTHILHITNHAGPSVWAAIHINYKSTHTGHYQMQIFHGINVHPGRYTLSLIYGRHTI